MPTARSWPEIAPSDLAACRALLRRHARSFHAASWLLPRRVREPASVLYGFCRVADDTVDVHGGRQDAVGQLRRRLDAAYRGQPEDSAVDRALAAVLARHQMPRHLPEALLEGLAWDADDRRYERWSDLLDYAARVAGSVGAMMAVLMGVRSEAALARACDLGIAMQLTNIARDVDEDAARGRLYLPAEWLREADTAGCVHRLLQEADHLYTRAAAGIGLLPLDCRPGINAARLLYAEIGHEVRRRQRAARPPAQGLQPVQSVRAVVPGHRKAWLLARAAATPWPGADGRHAPPLDANLPLVQAARRTAGAAMSPGDAPMSGPAGVIDLFLRLAQRERLQPPMELPP
ncbi:phytoene/squalene synthase family protein [Aquabacterium sp.]|uniref:phytoene/squalene synthase family protein n=1 Tax=Aquabacterium sp. TaxID=1872578 RepID=UPI0037839F9A